MVVFESGEQGNIICNPSREKQITGVKRCAFKLLISNDIAHKDMDINGLIIRHLMMIACISYEIISTISLPKLINIAPP